jgi:hypothetical protein
MNDVQAAAERIRRFKAGKDAMADIWPEFDNTDLGRRIDYATLARAYLALHDPTPLDEAWLESIGGDFNVEMCAYGFKIDSRNTLWLRANGQWWMTLDSMYGGRVCPHSRKTTRGEIKQVALALGIDLREPGGER